MTVKDLHVIVGLGATGLSCARYLNELKLPIAVTDTREAPPHLFALKEFCPDVQLSLGKLDTHLLHQASKIILSPGIAKSEPVIAAQIKRGVPVVGDIELFAQAVKAPVIAITGTNAKSTVTTLVGEMVKAAGFHAAVGGNLGMPVLDLLDQHPNADFFVLELSSFQLETTYSLQPRVATVLNITPDHMDRYADFAEYQQTKLRVYHNCNTAVCNLDDPLTDFHQAEKKYYFSIKENRKNNFGIIKKSQKTFLAYEENALLDTNELLVKGSHYQANALAALAIGESVQLPMDAMLNVLRTFPGLPHRCQFVREHKNVKWYNDSKGTNVGATVAAIEGLGAEAPNKLIVIAGGVGKNADFNLLAPVMKKYCRHVILIGEAASEIERAIAKDVAVTHASSFEEAVQLAATLALENDYILLSPACASFDMFNNFAHRGEVFTKLVMSL